MRNQGPPPSYEIAVTMKSPMELKKCQLCQNKNIRMMCLCDSHKYVRNDEHDGAVKDVSDQYLSVKNISHRHNVDGLTDYTTNARGDTCNGCDEECQNNNLCTEDIQNGNKRDDGFCRCSNSCSHICRMCGKDLLPETSNHDDINCNVPSTSGDRNGLQQCGDINSNYEGNDMEMESDGENEFDSLNEIGLIKVDMRKLIDDQTGLPTYEAALKLESSGYV